MHTLVVPPLTYRKHDPSIHPDSPFQERWKSMYHLITEGFLEYNKLLACGGAATNLLGRRGFRAHKLPGKMPNYFYYDEMAMEVARYVETKEVTLILLIRTQLFCDIPTVLGADVALLIEETE